MAGRGPPMRRSTLPRRALPRKLPRATASASDDAQDSVFQSVPGEAERFQQSLTLARNDAAAVTAGRPPASFHDSGLSLHYISALLRMELKKFDCATGYFSLQGLMLLLPELINKPELTVRLLVGMKDANSKVAAAQAMREHLVRNLSMGCMENAQDDDEPLATIETTSKMLASGRLRLNELNALKARAAQGMLHSKVYLTSAAVRRDESQMLITSANLSTSGLKRNIEAGMIASPDPAWSTGNFAATVCTTQELDDQHVKFQQLWEMGTDVTEDALADVRALLTPQPRDVLLGDAVEALMPDEAAPIDLLPKMKQLAPFQLRMKRSVLDGLQSHGTHFLIGDVGLGKTVVAVAVAFELRRVVPTVIVVAPAGTHATWRTELNNGGVRDCGIFTLQGLSSSKDGPTKRAVDETVLIILDEAHLLRNRFRSKKDESPGTRTQFEDDAGESEEERAAYTLIRGAVEKRAKLLIMTGTPYGAWLANVINQLDLVNAKLPEELADLLAIETSYKEMSEQAASEKYKSDKLVEWMRSPQDYVSMFTLKAIEETYGEVDRNSDCFVPFGPDGTLPKYRPGIEQVTVPFEPVMGGAAEQIEAIRVLCGPLAGETTRASSHSRRTGRSWGKADQMPIIPLEQTMQTALLSSPAAWHDALMRATTDIKGKWKNSSFICQDMNTRASAAKTLKGSLEALTQADAVSRDFKLEQLVVIAQKHLRSSEKLLIFVDRLSTAVYLKLCLEHAANNISGQPRRYVVESTAPGRTTTGRDSLVAMCAEPDSLDEDLLAEMVARFAPRANNYKATSNKPEIDILIATERSCAGINMQDAVAVVHYDLASQAIDAEQREGRLLRFKDTPSNVTIYTFEPSIERLVANLRLDEPCREYVERLRFPAVRLQERRLTASTYKARESAKGIAGPLGDIFFWEKVRRDIRRRKGAAAKEQRGMPAAGLSGALVHSGPHQLLLLLLDYTTGEGSSGGDIGGGQSSPSPPAQGRIVHVVYNVDTGALVPATRSEWLGILANAEVAPRQGAPLEMVGTAFRSRGPALRKWARTNGVPREHLRRDAGEEGEACVVVKQAVLLIPAKAVVSSGGGQEDTAALDISAEEVSPPV